MAVSVEQMSAISASMLAIAWTFVLLRCYVRIKLVKSFKVEDYLIVLSAAVLTVICACVFILLENEKKKSNLMELTDYLQGALKSIMILIALYAINTAIIKVSVGLLLLRLVTGRTTYRVLLIGSMIIFSTWTAVSFLFVIFECSPVSYFWLRTNPMAKGSCVSMRTTQGFSFACSAMDILFDWLFSIMPIFLLWSLKLPLAVKLSVLVSLGLGILASIACVIRFKYLVQGDDFTNTQNIITLGVLELGLGIVAASTATLRPLFQKPHIPGFSNNQSDPPPAAEAAPPVRWPVPVRHSLLSFLRLHHKDVAWDALNSKGSGVTMDTEKKVDSVEKGDDGLGKGVMTTGEDIEKGVEVKM